MYERLRKSELEAGVRFLTDEKKAVLHVSVFACVSGRAGRSLG